MESWVKDMYIEASQLWKEIGSPERGYAIFFSPIKSNPDLMIIGENPAGYKDFDESNVGIPEKHDYEIYKYKIAENMKKIFGFANIKKELFESVKFNLNFFATRNTSILSEQEYFSKTEKFSRIKAVEIIEKLKPKRILAEGIATFDKLLIIGDGKEIDEPVKIGNKRIFRKGVVFNTVKLIGIPHPSGAHGISDEIRKEIGKLISNEIK